MRFGSIVSASLVVAAASPALACGSCEHPERDVVLTRNVRRAQPDAQAAAAAPRGPLSWGQLNFLHTTDTHGWLEGHIREQNYGADWGDFVSFVKHMRQKADDLDVDLLVVDTGDLHDGAGLSDATGVSSYANGTGVNGQLSNPIFENIDYDVLTIGNHELYVSGIAYETFSQFAKVYGDRYLTSNVQIRNPGTGELEYIGKQYRYFTTPKGLRIMAFGVLFDFTGNSNASVVTKAAAMVKQPWFLDAVNYAEPIDLFLVVGHNPARPTQSSSTLKTVFDAIRAVKPDTPVQFFGGHTHIRDFAVFDDKSTGLESGRYCETVGWLSMTGIKSESYKGALYPKGVPHPSQRAVSVAAGATPLASNATAAGNSSLTYFRRYLDWNTLTFEYHAVGSQAKAFNTSKGVSVSSEITANRKNLNLTILYGCAPQTWCINCAPFMSNGSMFSLTTTALAATIITKERASTPRIIIANTGHIRFDLAKGPFDYDSSFIVSPFTDAFEFIPDVPWGMAKQVLQGLESGSFPSKKRSLTTDSFGFGQTNPGLSSVDSCIDPPVTTDHFAKRSYVGGRVVRRQAVTPGYTTSDDFGTDGDDTIHTEIPFYDYPNFFQANGSFPADGALSDEDKVDLIFLDYVAASVVSVLRSLGGNYTSEDVSYYLPKTFTTNSYLPEYAKNSAAWQADMPNCPVGLGIGYGTTA